MNSLSFSLKVVANEAFLQPLYEATERAQKIRDGEDIKVGQAKRYRTHDNNNDDGNGNIVMMVMLMVMIMMMIYLPVVMNAAKMVMAGKEDFDRDNEKHNAFNNNFEEEKL